MDDRFDPNNSIVRLCLQGVFFEENGKPEEASRLFQQALRESSSDFERFYAAYFLARRQTAASEKLALLKAALQYACSAKSDSINSALPSLYAHIAECCAALGDAKQARQYAKKAQTSRRTPLDKGPFYHGTRADLHTGDLLTPGGLSNYQPELKMNHIYFTASPNGAGLAAALAGGEGSERVYIVEPTGDFEDDPNVTDKKFPGNPTRSYRSRSPLKIVGECAAWTRQTPEEIRAWRERLDHTNSEIIN